jgi:multiple sugar transport system substrate-binding protein
MRDINGLPAQLPQLDVSLAETIPGKKRKHQVVALSIKPQGGSLARSRRWDGVVSEARASHNRGLVRCLALCENLRRKSFSLRIFGMCGGSVDACRHSSAQGIREDFMRRHRLGFGSGALALIAGAALAAAMSGAARAETMTMWVRDSGATLTTRVIDRWNETHPADRIELTVIPHDQMVTKFATAAAAGEGPDLLSLDLIFMPDFMRAGFLTDITDLMAANPHVKKVVQAHLDLATYNKRLYAVPFTPDNSILLYNKALFRQAGLDPDKPPQTSAEILAAARKIRALGPDIYGWYFSGACPGCNIFTMAPQMWATPGTVVLPSGCDAEPLKGGSVRQVLQNYRTMWQESLIPHAAKVDPGANFMSVFMTGKIGMQGSGNFAVGMLKEKAPNIDFGIAFLPGPGQGEVSSFAGGDVLGIPKASKHPKKALEVLQWVLTDDPQVEVYAKTGNLPSRTDLASNKYFDADPRLTVTAKALAVAQTPWTFHFNDMSNDNSSPWIEMIQTAVFAGDIDGAMAKAKKRMTQIQCE